MPIGPFRRLHGPSHGVRADIVTPSLFNDIYDALESISGAYGQAYDVRDYGGIPDGTTNNLAAIQAAGNAMLAANRGGYIYLGGDGDYLIDGIITLTAPNATDLVGFGIVGNGPGQKLIQVADNAPHIELVGANIHSLFIGGFSPTWSGAPNVAKTSRNVIKCTSTGNFYNSEIRDMSITRGHYAFLCGSSMNTWGVNHRNLRTTEMTGGFASYTGASGQPNNGFDQIYIGAQSAVGPIFLFNAMNAEMDRIEVNQANQGPILLQDTGGGNYVIGMFGCEGGVWATADRRLFVLDGSTLEAKHIFLTGSATQVTNLFRTADRGHIHVEFLIQEFTRTGSGKLWTANVGGANVNAPNAQRGEIIFDRIRDMDGFVSWVRTGSNQMCLTDVGNTGSADAVRVMEWFEGSGKQIAWNADAALDHTDLPDGAPVQAWKALAASRIYTLPHGDYLHSGYRKKIIKSATTTGDLIIQRPGGTEVARITAATKGSVTLVWDRSSANGPGYDTWTVVGKETL